MFFLFELAWAGRERRRRGLALAVAAGALALGLCAVFLLPFREAARETIEFASRRTWYAESKRSKPLRIAMERSSMNVVPYSVGELGRGNFDPKVIEPAAYAGSLLLPLALLGLGARRREKWPLAVTGLAGLAAWAGLPGFADALAKLPLFDLALNERLVFLAAFSTAALAALGAQRLEEDPSAAGPRLAAAAAATLLALAVLNFRLLPRLEKIGMSTAELRDHFLVQALPLGAAALVGGALRRGRLGRLAVPLLVVLLLGQRRLEAGPVYPTFPARAFYPPLPLLDRIPRGEAWRVAAVGYSFVPSVSALYELEDVRGYEAMTFLPLVETYPLWCVHQPVWFNRVDDPTKPFLSFLNVRYVYFSPGDALPPGWKVVAEDGSGRILENPAVLPRAFVPRSYFREPEPPRQMERLLSIRDFAEAGVVEGPGAPQRRNGDARLRIVSYSAQEMELEIDARESALVATSVTRWPGWRLTVGGVERPLLTYNRAFLAFEVPPGRHRAVLSYRPRSFSAGLWVSGLSLLAALAIFGRRRSGGAPSESAKSAAIGESVRAEDHSIQSEVSPTGSR